MNILKLNDFESYKNDNLFVKKDSSEEFEYSDGFEEEKYILDSIVESEDKTSNSDELKSKVKDWSSKYHLSKERSNLLRAIDIKNKENLNVLEVGGGCGAITRYLGEEFGHVDAIEGSLVRSEIISERCSDLENVQVYCSDIFSTNLPDNFYDLVIIIGVLEYSNIYSGENLDPIESAKVFLEIAKRGLKKNGKIVIAIENKFGLKYFSGAAEDHTNLKFDSIIGYSNPNTPVTYSKNELKKILTDLGFIYQNWIYPYPDYKLPTTFFTDSAIRKNELHLDNWIDTPFTNSGASYKMIFNESLALEGIYKADMLSEFSNSFLIIAGKNEYSIEQQWLVKKLNSNRVNQYCTEITLENINDHLKINRRYLFPNKSEGAKIESQYLHQLTNEKYILGELIVKKLDKHIVNKTIFNGILKYSTLLKEYLIKHFSTQNYDDDNQLILKGEAIDVVFRNIIVKSNDEWIHFDNEWSAKGDKVTLDYVLFRAVFQYLENYSYQIFDNPGDEKLDTIVFNVMKNIFPDLTVKRYSQLFEREKKFQQFVHIGNTEESITDNQKTRKILCEDLNDIESLEKFDPAIAELGSISPNKDLKNKINKKIRSRMKVLKFKLGIERGNKFETSCDVGYDILIPIYNAYNHLERCIDSVIKCTNKDHNIYLLNDASPDKRVYPLLKEYADTNTNVKLLNAEENLGFIKNINKGFSISDKDVIILNSDTEVTENWIDKLHNCLHSSEKIGIVSPLSNNATILSVPVMNQPNEIPQNLTVESFAKLIESVSLRMYPRIPTAVGFCMLITREVLNEVGSFDPIFGLGYGEENDFCLRARESGYEIACCDDTYIHHYGSASFIDVNQIDERKLSNHQTLLKRYPNYDIDILEYCRLNPLREVQERIISALRKNEKKGNILHVIHDFYKAGGTELHTKNIAEYLRSNFNSAIIYPAPISKKWIDLDETQFSEGLRVIKIAKENVRSNEYFLKAPGDLDNELVETNFAQFLSGSNYDIVHFQHLFNWGTLMLPFIAKQLGKKVVLSLHDFFFLCPEYNLVDQTAKKKCNKFRVDENDAQCQYCLASKRFSKNSNTPILLTDYIVQRNEIINEIFEIADALIVPSNFVKNFFAKSFNKEILDKMFVISHGVKKSENLLSTKQSTILNVGFIGNATNRKGITYFLESVALLKKEQCKFEIFGGVPPAIIKTAKKLKVKLNSNYKIKDLYKLLSHVDVIVIPSVWNETFSLTLSEVQALGIPVIATDVGAMSERIIDNETGFLIPPSDTFALAQKLIYLSKNKNLLNKIKDNLKSLEIKTIEENMNEYGSLYTTLLNNKNLYQEQFSSQTNRYKSNKPKVSIIILTYNQLTYTKQCIESIYDNTELEFEIIIVDNNSSSEVKSYLNYLKSEKYNVKVIFNSENRGFPIGVNQGLLVAESEYILIANNDIIVTNNWLTKLLEVAESDENIGLVGPISNSVSGIQLDPNANYNQIEEMNSYAQKISNENSGITVEFPRIAFLCTLIKRNVIEKIGGLDERFTPGNFEDDDFCLRSQLAGYKTVIAKDVFVHHYGSVSFKQDGNKKYGERLMINEEKFIQKWGSNPEGIWLKGEKLNKQSINYPINQDRFIQFFERAMINIEDEEYEIALKNLKNALDNFESSTREGYEKVTQDELLNIAGNLALAKNNLEEAKMFFEKELEKNPNSTKACFGLGEIFYIAEMYDESKTMLEWAIANDEGNSNAKNRLLEVNGKLKLPKEHNSLLEENKV